MTSDVAALRRKHLGVGHIRCLRCRTSRYLGSKGWFAHFLFILLHEVGLAILVFLTPHLFYFLPYFHSLVCLFLYVQVVLALGHTVYIHLTNVEPLFISLEVYRLALVTGIQILNVTTQGCLEFWNLI